MQSINNPVFHHPFTMVVSGATGTGKTEWLAKFIESATQIINPSSTSLFYCYGEENERTAKMAQNEVLTKLISRSDSSVQPTSHSLPIRTFNGIPIDSEVKEEATNAGGHLLMVLDDLMVNIKASYLDVLFTRGSHNWGVSVILVTQHLFSKEIRTSRANAHYLCLM